MTATAALDDGLISQYTFLPDPGTFTIPNCTGSGCVLHNNAFESLKSLDVATALTASDDVFFYTLGYDFWIGSSRYGKTPIQSEAANYGFGRPSGIDLPNEYSGQVDSPALRQLQHRQAPKAFPYPYYGVADNLELAFGQGETVVTPIQIANAFATFANGGTRYAPQLAAGVVSPSGTVLKRFAPQITGHVSLPPSTYDPMMQGFEGVILNTTYGTASLTFAGYPYSALPIAGKTGTATESTNTNIQPTAWFVAFGPTPPAKAQYVVAVVIDQAGYGAAAAAPVVRKVFQYLIKHPVGPVQLRPASAGG